jgi:hypothetical protein
MLARASLFVALALVTPALAQEIECEGAFAIDSSEARLIEIYGADNVVTGIVPGPEGTEMLATTVFPDDPQQSLQFVWSDEEELSGPSYIELPARIVAPGGVRIGQSLAEVEALNGEPFRLLGFGWDYGGSAGFETGALADLPGGCILSVSFDANFYPQDVDTLRVQGDVELSSDDLLLARMQVKIYGTSIGYPHPDFRD